MYVCMYVRSFEVHLPVAAADRKGWLGRNNCLWGKIRQEVSLFRSVCNVSPDVGRGLVWRPCRRCNLKPGGYSGGKSVLVAGLLVCSVLKNAQSRQMKMATTGLAKATLKRSALRQQKTFSRRGYTTFPCKLGLNNSQTQNRFDRRVFRFDSWYATVITSRWQMVSISVVATASSLAAGMGRCTPDRGTMQCVAPVSFTPDCCVELTFIVFGGARRCNSWPNTSTSSPSPKKSFVTSSISELNGLSYTVWRVTGTWCLKRSDFLWMCVVAGR